MEKLTAALTTLSLVAFTGCTTLPSAIIEHSPLPIVQASDADFVVTDLAQPEGKGGIYVRLASPDSNYRTQDAIHRWVAQDIYEYQVSIKEGSEVLSNVTIPRKGDNPKSGAKFVNLKLKTTYRVEVIAKGNQDGTDASLTLTASPASATFSFDGDNDVDDLMELPINVVLADTAFSGSANVNVSNTDGRYTEPTAQVTGSAF